MELEEYLTLDNFGTALKFATILSSGVYTGGSIYMSESHIPSLLEMTDMDQALVQFRYFWHRCRQMPVSGILTGLFGVGSYLVKRETKDLPWLVGGLGFIFYGFYTFKFIYPKSIGPLLNPNLLKENDEPYVRDMFKKFAGFHNGRMILGTAAFFTFTFCYFKSTF